MLIIKGCSTRSHLTFWGGGYESGVGIAAPATENASLQILFKCPTPAIVFRNATKTLTSCSHLTRCTIPCACHAKRDLNVQKWSAPGVSCTFWLANVLRATTACTFSSLIWPDGCAPAALASLLFDPQEPQIIGKKHSVSRLSYLFAHLHLFSSDSFSSLIFPLLLFSLLLFFSSLWLFPSLLFICPYCRKFDF